MAMMTKSIKNSNNSKCNVKKRHPINCWLYERFRYVTISFTHLILLNLVFLAIVWNVSLVPSRYYLTGHLVAIKLGSANVDLTSIFIRSCYDRIMRKVLSGSWLEPVITLKKSQMLNRIILHDFKISEIVNKKEKGRYSFNIKWLLPAMIVSGGPLWWVGFDCFEGPWWNILLTNSKR